MSNNLRVILKILRVARKRYRPKDFLIKLKEHRLAVRQGITLLILFFFLRNVFKIPVNGDSEKCMEK